jgi:ATP-dependent Clp protease ATP-binding subunit ClpC
MKLRRPTPKSGMDDGRLTDGQGRLVDFRNTVLIMTSNLGTEYVRKSGSLGFIPPTSTSEDREAQDKIQKALKSTFRPEFLNRIDEIITFSPLSLEDMVRIVDLQMKEIQERMGDSGLTIQLTDDARKWLAETGYDSAFGARPLRRALQKYLESPLSLSLLSGEFPRNAHIQADVNEARDGLVFSTADKPIPVEIPQETKR